MIRVALCSPDLKLQPLLAPALGRDFQVLLEPDNGRLTKILHDGQVRALLLDLDLEFTNVDQQIEFFEEIGAAGTASNTLAARSRNIRRAHRLIRLPEELEASDVA